MIRIFVVTQFPPFRSGSGLPRMHEKELYEYIRLTVVNSIRGQLGCDASNIACEHSSGLDSNAIMGCIVNGIGIAPDKIHTITWMESVDDIYMPPMRQNFDLIDRQCHEIVSRVPYCSSFNFNGLCNQDLKIFGCPPQHVSSFEELKLLNANHCSVFFSGFGGDQALSHHGRNVGTDLATFHSLKAFHQWMGTQCFPLRHFLSRFLASKNRYWARSRTLRLDSKTYSFFEDLLVDSLTSSGRNWLGPVSARAYPWELDSYSPLKISLENRILADWIAVRMEEEFRAAAYFNIHKVFPFLNEQVVSTLLNQEALLFRDSVKTGNGRLVHRRAFAPYLPLCLDDLPNKLRPFSPELRDIIDNEPALNIKESCLFFLGLSELHPQVYRYWDVDMIKTSVDPFLHSGKATYLQPRDIFNCLRTINVLSHWWKKLDDRG